MHSLDDIKNSICRYLNRIKRPNWIASRLASSIRRFGKLFRAHRPEPLGDARLVRLRLAPPGLATGQHARFMHDLGNEFLLPVSHDVHA
jgi:hypothetical protein